MSRLDVWSYARRVRVLVIGGTGFISGALVKRFGADGHVVAIFHRGELARDPPRDAESIVGDRRRIDAFTDRLRAWRPDVVVDCVAFDEADARGVIDAFRGVAKRLVVLSSIDVYRAYDRLMRVEIATPDRIALTESAPLREIPFPRRRITPDPTDVMWSYDKIPVERIALSEPTALPATVLRLPAVFGPGDHKRRRVGGYLARMQREPTLALDAELASWRWTRTYIDDVAIAISIAMTSERAANRIYNVGDETALTEGDWVRAIARAAGYSGRIVETPRADLPPEIASELETQDFAHDLVLDTTRIREELDVRAHTALDDALATTIAWERTFRV
jgi:nucleoside-diphosphate-sugar epimerase